MVGNGIRYAKPKPNPPTAQDSSTCQGVVHLLLSPTLSGIEIISNKLELTPGITQFKSRIEVHTDQPTKCNAHVPIVNQEAQIALC